MTQIPHIFYAFFKGYTSNNKGSVVKMEFISLKLKIRFLQQYRG